MIRRILLVIGIAGAGPAGADVIGRLAAVQGDVQIESKVLNKTSTALLGEDISEGDTVLVGPAGSAKVIAYDENELNLFANAKLGFEHYDADKHNSLLRLLSGRVRAIVKQLYDGVTTKFEIQTPSADVSVKGTDFVLEERPSDWKVVTFTGSVQFAGVNKGGGIRGPVSVGPGQASVLKGSRAPSPPETVAKSELDQIDKDTKIEAMPPPKEKPVPKDQPSPKKRKRAIQL